MRKLISVLGIAALALAAGSPASAWVRCDFLTGGGFIVRDSGAKANFGIGGSCRPGGDGHGLWGHLEYIDHGFVTPDVKQLNIHWLTITGYFFCGDEACLTFVDPPGQPTGTRLICGTARTNLPSPDDSADWAVKVTDNKEPGKGNDTFMIQVKSQTGPFTYSTGDDPLAGGNIQLHKPNNSTGLFSGPPTSDNCPAFVPPPTACMMDSQCPSGSCNTATGTCCPPGSAFVPSPPSGPPRCCRVDPISGQPVCAD